MRKAIVLLIVAMLLVPLLLVAAGCSSEESTEDAEKQLCQDLQNLNTALASLTDISMDTSIDDLQSNAQAVEDAWNDVVDSASKVTSAQIDDLKNAVNDLIDTIENLSSATSIADALESIGEQITAVENAWDELTTSLNCDALLSE